jgi:hypothetical protein
MTPGGFDFTATDCLDWMRDARSARYDESLADDHVTVARSIEF